MTRTWPRSTVTTLALGAVLGSACAQSSRDEAPPETTAAGAAVVSAGAGNPGHTGASTPPSAGSGTAEAESPPVISTPIPTEKPRGRIAPEFTLTLLDGKSVRLEDFAGKVVLIDFWATWCGPCRMSIPHLIELQNEFGDDGFAVLGVSLDRAGVNVVRSYVQKAGINYPIAMGNPGIVRSYGGPAGIRSIPTAFLVDREGYVAQVIVGYRPKPDLERMIRPLLEG